MKTIFITIIFCCCILFCSAQELKNIEFDIGQVTLIKSVDYSQRQNRNDVPLQILNTVFNEESYETYANLFLNGECPFSKEDYWKWKNENYQNATPVSKFEFELNNETFCVVQYYLSSDKLRFMAPLTLKFIDSKWYLLQQSDSYQLAFVKGFFATLDYTQINNKAKSDFPLIMNGQELVMNMYDRYDSETILHGLLNQFFLDPIQPNNQMKSNIKPLINYYLNDFDLNEKKFKYLSNLIEGIQLVKAAQLLSMHTTKTEPEIVEEMKSMLNLN